MTCVVGWVSSGRVVMGADSCASTPYEQSIRADRKIFWNGEFLLGHSGNIREAQIARYHFSPPRMGVGQDEHGYMVTAWVDALREAMRKSGAVCTKDGVDTMQSEFLVAYRDHLYRICSDFQVGIQECGYWAIGSGGAVALGVLHATAEHDGWTPRGRVEAALAAAEQFCIGVKRPFHVEESPKRD